MAMKPGIELIREERRRQIELEGWTPEHDRSHPEGMLTHVARCYLWAEKGEASSRDMSFPREWEWKPKDRISNLVRAGALLLAEYERGVAVNIDINGRSHPDVMIPFIVDGIGIELDRLRSGG